MRSLSKLITLIIITNFANHVYRYVIAFSNLRSNNTIYFRTVLRLYSSTSKALQQLQMAPKDIKNNSDVEAAISSKTESIADDDKLSFDEELSNIDVFEEAINDASDEDQHFSDNNDNSDKEDQAEITAGNATYYNIPFSSRLRQRKIFTQQLELLLRLNMKWMLSNYCSNMKLFLR